MIYPVLSPAPSIADYEVSLKAEDFSSGFIEIYLRYTDSDNYYKARIS
jgi:hypothetical protein